MNALNLYVTTCRLVMKANLESKALIEELDLVLPQLHQSLTCTVCGQILVEPYTPTETSCQHHVCKKCMGGKKRLKPSCSWCKDYETYIENIQIQIIIQCYRKLCHFIKQTGLCKYKPTLFNDATSSHLQLFSLIEEASRESLSITLTNNTIHNSNESHPSPHKQGLDISNNSINNEKSPDKGESHTNIPSELSEVQIKVEVEDITEPTLPRYFGSPSNFASLLSPENNLDEIDSPFLEETDTETLLLPSPERLSTGLMSPLHSAANEVDQSTTFKPKVSSCSPIYQLTSVGTTPISPIIGKRGKAVENDSSKIRGLSVVSLPSMSLSNDVSQNTLSYGNHSYPGMNGMMVNSGTPLFNNRQNNSFVDDFPIPPVSDSIKQTYSNIRGRLNSPNATRRPVTTNSYSNTFNTGLTCPTTNIDVIHSNNTSTLTCVLPTGGTIFSNSNLDQNFQQSLFKHESNLQNTANMYSVMYNDPESTKITFKRKPPDFENFTLPSPDKLKTDDPKKAKPRPKAKLKRKGCRCGNATPTPGKLTCCGQRCPCYVEAKACMECQCKGCRNPHRPGGGKVRPVLPNLDNIQIHPVHSVPQGMVHTRLPGIYTTNTAGSTGMVIPNQGTLPGTVTQTIRAVHAMHAFQAVHGMSNVQLPGGMHQLINISGTLINPNMNSHVNVHHSMPEMSLKPVSLALSSLPTQLLIGERKSLTNSLSENSDVELDI